MDAHINLVPDDDILDSFDPDDFLGGVSPSSRDTYSDGPFASSSALSQQSEASEDPVALENLGGYQEAVDESELVEIDSDLIIDSDSSGSHESSASGVGPSSSPPRNDDAPAGPEDIFHRFRQQRALRAGFQDVGRHRHHRHESATESPLLMSQPGLRFSIADYLSSMYGFPIPQLTEHRRTDRQRRGREDSIVEMEVERLREVRRSGASGGSSGGGNSGGGGSSSSFGTSTPITSASILAGLAAVSAAAEADTESASAPSQPPPQGQGQTAVIDLTEEPESPETQHWRPPPRPRPLPMPDMNHFHHSHIWPLNPDSPPRRHRHHHHHHHHLFQSRNRHATPSRANLRRQMSQNRQTPSLARSDGSLLGSGGAAVIDLTGDSSPVAADQQQQQQQQTRHNGSASRDPQAQATSHEATTTDPTNITFRLFGLLQNRMRRADEVQFIRSNRVSAFSPDMNNPLADNPVHFNYQANGFDRRAPEPKPTHIPPPPPRPGFTRSTCESQVVICPSCEQELTYDPEEGESQQPPPAKKARTRKDREEHHFWAVKACGHVYCKSCYENRRPSTKSTIMTNFSADSTKKKVLCAVENCDSDLTNKGSWIGIFL